MIARPAFQDWAAAFPLTRGLAKRRALALFDLTAGFVYSQVLRAVVELDLLDRLAEGPRSVAELAAETGLPPDRAERLLAAAASLELLARVDGGYRLGQVGAALRGLPGVAEMVRHHDLLYRDLADPVALFRGEATPELARFWGYVGGHRTHALSAEETAPYTRLMAATQTMISAEVLASYPVRRHRHLLDIGGGDGSFLQAAAARASRLQVTLFDLPAVAAQAEVRFAGSGLSPRARAVGGDFFADALPVGADAVSLLRVLYDHDDGPALEILRRAFAALPPGGSLIVGEPMAETPGAPRVGDAYFSLYILAMTHGRPRSAQALTELIAAAGFVEIRRRRTRRPFLTGLITARRPS
ncbi:MAG: methyltransferase [Pikeienuella sp.]